MKQPKLKHVKPTGEFIDIDNPPMPLEKSNPCRDAIERTLAAEELSEFVNRGGFLPENIRKILQDAITKTD